MICHVCEQPASEQCLTCGCYRCPEHQNECCVVDSRIHAAAPIAAIGYLPESQQNPFRFSRCWFCDQPSETCCPRCGRYHCHSHAGAASWFAMPVWCQACYVSEREGFWNLVYLGLVLTVAIALLHGHRVALFQGSAPDVS
jgi:hypothetical protein